MFFFFFIYMFSFALCIYLSFLLSLVLNGTPGVQKLVVVTHRVVLFSLPFSSACFSDRRGRRSPSTIDDLLFCSCTLAPLHQRHYRSACFCLFLSKPIAPKKPHLCAEKRWSILTNSSFFSCLTKGKSVSNTQTWDFWDVCFCGWDKLWQVLYTIIVC